MSKIYDNLRLKFPKDKVQFIDTHQYYVLNIAKYSIRESLKSLRHEPFVCNFLSFITAVDNKEQNICLIYALLALQAKHRIIVKTNMPAALIIRKGVFSEYIRDSTEKEPKIPMMRRREAIKIIVKNLKGDEVIISTTGKISRELYYDGKESETNFYVVGSMGCAISIGFGIARQKPNKKVIVLDGDGAVLMKMGTLATVGHYKPPNLIHIVLDNEAYDSTGGQDTVSNTISIEKVALNSGYLNSVKAHTQEELEMSVKNALETKGPHCILVKVLKGADKDLGRPKLTSLQIKERFMKFLQEFS